METNFNSVLRQILTIEILIGVIVTEPENHLTQMHFATDSLKHFRKLKYLNGIFSPQEQRFTNAPDHLKDYPKSYVELTPEGNSWHIANEHSVFREIGSIVFSLLGDVVDHMIRLL